jgi:hypothetical protein
VELEERAPNDEERAPNDEERALNGEERQEREHLGEHGEDEGAEDDEGGGGNGDLPWRLSQPAGSLSDAHSSNLPHLHLSFLFLFITHSPSLPIPIAHSPLTTHHSPPLLHSAQR